jgi:hypothetical protein
MLELFALELCKAYAFVQSSLDQLRLKEKENPTQPVSVYYAKFVLKYGITPLTTEIEKIKLDDELIFRCKRFQVLLNRDHANWTPESLYEAMHAYLIDVHRALGKKRYTLIPPSNDNLFGKEMPFGETVYKDIPNARQDIKDAANCLAFELHTACVFHLMRAAEHGLRRLARRLKVVVTHNGMPSRYEDEEWSKIIDGVKAKAEESRKIQSKPEKRQRVKLYSDLADHCLFIKDIFRNDVSHTRAPYVAEEAKNAWGRVERFLQLLAESKR